MHGRQALKSVVGGAPLTDLAPHAPTRQTVDFVHGHYIRRPAVKYRRKTGTVACKHMYNFNSFALRLETALPMAVPRTDRDLPANQAQAYAIQPSEMRK